MKNTFEKSDFFAITPESEKIKALNESAQSVKGSFVYYKPLTDIEIKKKNVEINQDLHEIENVKEERKELNSQISNLQKKVSLNNSDVVRGHVETCEKVWVVNNPHSGFEETINSEGLIIERHRLKHGATMSLFQKDKDKKDAV